MTKTPSLLHLSGITQHYAWGKPAHSSLVGALGKIQEADRPCAEYWIGAHPNGPAIVKNASGSLSEILESNSREFLGKNSVEQFGTSLPFLFKILSIGAPLSIQCHPSKEVAKRLHEEDPKNYPDDNHKPEIAIALTPLVCLQGFRSPEQTKLFFDRRAALQDALQSSDQDASSTESTLRAWSKRLFSHDSATLLALCKRHADQIAVLANKTPEDEWFLKAFEMFPGGDPGLFCFYLLELKTIPPGEAIFTDAGIPHAYLDGEIVECMAASDNTVRAGLTPKFQDVDTLLSILDYSCTPQDLEVTQGENSGTLFKTPTREFQIEKLKFSSERQLSLAGRESPALIFCLSGSATITASEAIQLTAGEACLIAAHVDRCDLTSDQSELYYVFVP